MEGHQETLNDLQLALGLELHTSNTATQCSPGPSSATHKLWEVPILGPPQTYL